MDNALAASLWRLLSEHARQVDLKLAKSVPTPPSPGKAAWRDLTCHWKQEEVHEESFLDCEQEPHVLVFRCFS